MSNEPPDLHLPPPPPEMSNAEISAWIRGYTRGVTNDPPPNMGDPMFDNRDGPFGTYSEGYKLGIRVRGDRTDLDQSGTLHVESDPPGLEVSVQAEMPGREGLREKVGVTPLDCAIATGWYRVQVGDRWMTVNTQPGTKTTITADWQLHQEYR